jgi:hypothetical protein
MRFVQVTPPTEEPVSLATAKAHLRVEISDDDALISALITSARRVAEAWTKRAIVTQTWDLTMDNFPFGGGYFNRAVREQGLGPFWLPTNAAIIDIPKPPVQSIVSVTYTDYGGITRTIDPSTYLFAVGAPSRLQPVYGQIWPLSRPQVDGVAVRFVCGYGPATSAPLAVCQGMLLLVGNWYENRESSVVGTIVNALPLAVETLFSTEDYGQYT